MVRVILSNLKGPSLYREVFPLSDCPLIVSSSL